MNNRYSIVIVLLVMLSLFTSCMGDSESEATYFDDAALSSFTLGSLKCTMHTTTKTGKDSTYVGSVTGSKYAFSIDQINGLVYNVDSLPAGTHADKCLVTVNARNGGVVYLKSATSDSLTIINSSDSLDFSKPRIIYVVSNDASANRKYTVDVRVHKEEAEKLYWTRKSVSSQLASLETMKSVSLNGSLFVCGTSNGAVKMFTTKTADGSVWSELAVPFRTMPAMVAGNGAAYALADNMLYKTEDGSRWDVVRDAAGISTLAGVSRSELYAIGTDGKMLRSLDGGVTWDYDNIDSDAALLPVRDVNGVCMPSLVNPEIDRMLIVGYRNVATDTTPMVWTKNVDVNNPAQSQPWMHQPFGSDTWHHAPVLNGLSVVGYGNGLLMFGSVDRNGAETRDNFRLLYSWDSGLNWWTDKRFSLPADMKCSTTSMTMVADAGKRFWIICGGTGEVWQGYYSSWTWE